MPSEKVLGEKQAKVAELTEVIKGAVAGVLFDYKGITVEQDTKLRREMRESGVIYTVEKNSMLRFALEKAGYAAMTDVLSGTTAIAVSTTDQTAAARILGKMAEAGAKDNKFLLKAGFVEGVCYDAKSVMALSKIPSKDILLSQLVGSLQGPMQKLAAIVQAVADSKAE